MRLEPEWWGRARSLEGHLTYSDIARQLGVGRSSVIYALKAKTRKATIERSSRNWRAFRDAGGSAAGRAYDPEKQKARRIVRDEFKAAGGTDPKELRRLYKRMECH